MTSRALREAFHREFMTFFERAERTRRWNVFTDIAWDRLSGSAQRPDSRLVRCAETFCGVEMYLPDYLRSHLDLMRGDYGRAWFAANWGYEEAKHSLALREYLTGTSTGALLLADRMRRRGVNVQPIVYPAVPDAAARLRFFLNTSHTDAQIDEAVAILAQETGGAAPAVFPRDPRRAGRRG
jgi:hypothetical protein